MVKRRSGAMAVATIFREIVARPARRSGGRRSHRGPAGGLFGDDNGRLLRLADDDGAERLDGLLFGIVVEHGRQVPADVPFQVVFEHAGKMRARTRSASQR
jgi:hypothetical protein